MTLIINTMSVLLFINKIKVVIIVRIIKPITRLDYDSILARTTLELYKGIGVNFNHVTDSNIGKVLNVYADANDPNLVIGEMEVRDEVMETYGDKFKGASVEIVMNYNKDVFIPVNVSLLTYEVEPAVEDTKNFTLTKYSKEGQDGESIVVSHNWDKMVYSTKEEPKKEDSSIVNEILSGIRDIFSKEKVEFKVKNEGDLDMDQKDFESKIADYCKKSDVEEVVKGLFSKESEGIVETFNTKVKDFEDFKEVFGESKEKFGEFKEVFSKGMETIKELEEKVEALSKLEEKYGKIEALNDKLLEKYGLKDGQDPEPKKYKKEVVLDIF